MSRGKSLGKSKRSIRIMAFDAIMAALGVLLMLFLRFPLLPTAAPWLIYDLGDLAAILAGLIAGPIHAIIVLLIICIVQMATPNASGFWGFVMHFVASGIMVIVPALIWQRKQNRSSLIFGLVGGALALIIIMIPLNIIITPIFTGASVEAVLKMIMPIIVPFNLIKGLLNTVFSYLIFAALLRAGKGKLKDWRV